MGVKSSLEGTEREQEVRRGSSLEEFCHEREQKTGMVGGKLKKDEGVFSGVVVTGQPE